MTDKPDEKPITIKGVAVLFDNGIMLYGDPPLRHFNLVHFMNIGRAEKLHGEQGFMTSDGRFARRKPAARIALESGQIEKLKFHSSELFSEDLF